MQLYLPLRSGAPLFFPHLNSTDPLLTSKLQTGLKSIIQQEEVQVEGWHYLHLRIINDDFPSARFSFHQNISR